MFIYVFSNQDRDQLLSDGYELLKSNEFEEVYIFLYGDDKTSEKFKKLDKYIISDVLTF